MSYDSLQDWQMQSPGWREYQIFKCLCTLKDNMEATRLTDIYTLNVQGSNINLGASTTYYFAGCASIQPITTPNIVSLVAPKAGTMTNVHITFWVNGTLASAENCTLSVRVNNTTDYLVTNTLQLTSVTNLVNVDNLSIPIAEDDSFEFKLVTGAFGTPPTQVRIFGNITIAR